jgi:hypothetical protein
MKTTIVLLVVVLTLAWMVLRTPNSCVRFFFLGLSFHICHGSVEHELSHSEARSGRLLSRRPGRGETRSAAVYRAPRAIYAPCPRLP